MRLQRLMQGDGGGGITLHELTAKITLLRETYKTDEDAGRILDALDAWSRKIC